MPLIAIFILKLDEPAHHHRPCFSLILFDLSIWSKSGDSELQLIKLLWNNNPYTGGIKTFYMC